MTLLTGRNRIYLLLAVLAVAALLAVGWATLAGAQGQNSGAGNVMAASGDDSDGLYDGPSGIWVTGNGKASGEPDIAVASVGVEAIESTAASARSKAASAMSRVRRALTHAGVAPKDIQTSYFNISPRYEWVEVQRCESNASSDSEGQTEGPAGKTCYDVSERRLTGYSVSNQLTVTIRRLSISGRLIDQVTNAAGDMVRINGIRFDVEEPQPLQDAAMKNAVADMKRKAKMMADLSGVKLGRLVYLSEEPAYIPPQPLYARAESMAFDSAGQDTTISGGELEFNVTVQGVFLIDGEAESEED